MKFRNQIVELARNRRTLSELADEFEPTEQTIRSWLKQVNRDDSTRADSLVTDERAEFRAMCVADGRHRGQREHLMLAVEREPR